MANRVFVFHQSLKNYPRNFNNVNHKFRHVLTFPVNQKDNTVSSVSCIVHTHTHVPLLLFLEFSRNRHCAIFTFRSVGSKIARRRLNSRDQKFQENRCQQNKLAGRNLSSSSTVVRVTQERNVNTRFLAAIEIVTSWNNASFRSFTGCLFAYEIVDPFESFLVSPARNVGKNKGDRRTTRRVGSFEARPASSSIQQGDKNAS